VCHRLLRLAARVTLACAAVPAALAAQVAPAGPPGAAPGTGAPVGTAAARPPAADSALVAALTRVRMPLRLDSAGALLGDGARLLVDHGRAAQFLLVGEEHGVAQVPALTGALFRALVPAGYRHLAIETGHGVAAHLNRLVQDGDTEANVRRFTEAYWPGVPFYALREEARMLGDVVRAAGGRDDVLWGIDYDVLGDRWALRRLRELAPNASARAAADRVIAAADSGLDRALREGNPSHVFMFAAADTTFAALGRAYGRDADPVRRTGGPRPGPQGGTSAPGEAARTLALLDETLRINRLFAAGRGYESNLLRAANLKRRFGDLVDAAAGRAGGRASARVMVKLGANHLLRGRTWTNTYDVGTLAHELAERRGGQAYGVLVVGGRGSRHAELDPRTFHYSPAPGEMAGAEWARSVYAAADSAAWTVFDLRALRSLVDAGTVRGLPPRLAQVVWGYDALVVLGGSTPSEPLVAARPGRPPR
jgi:erythromycin esterase-like protein